MYRIGRPSCEDCRALYSKKKKEPPCYTECGKVEILPDNYLTYGLIEKYGHLFFNGSGGISAEGIRLALDSEMIPEDLRSEIVQKITIFISVVIRNRQ